MNLSLRHYGTDATRSIYGVLGRMLVFVTMPLLGLGQGLQPIVGFNYGAKRLDRVARAFVIATAASLALGGALCALLDAVPGAILRLFTTNSEVIAQGIRPLRITTMLLPLVGIQVMAFSYFQALGKSLAALVSSLSRQFLFLVPLLLLLPPFLGASGVWIAYPIADGAAVLLCVIWVRAEQRRLGTEAAGSLAAEEARAR